jgi:hypothetical protein
MGGFNAAPFEIAIERDPVTAMNRNETGRIFHESKAPPDHDHQWRFI